MTPNFRKFLIIIALLVVTGILLEECAKIVSMAPAYQSKVVS